LESAPRPNAGQAEDGGTKPLQIRVPHADLISLQAVVTVLVKKGIVTAEELYEIEKQIRTERREALAAPVVSIPSKPNPTSQPSHNKTRTHHHRDSGLKRIMSKRRWTRRLGTFLFGWQWKKVKRERKKPTETDLAGVED
jgi:hypothetical protein